MIFGSVCSGIEAASVAWHPLGWRTAFVSEIEAFPRAVLSHRFPEVPLHGDFTTIRAGEYAAIDLLVGGTPCQSFSVAGLRGGLADDRGNLALEFLRLADRLRPRWLVWENVPGVLSSNGGRDFGSILGGMVELRYGFAYRVFDAQHFGVPQRRRRVFVVGYIGDWRRAAAVLFERHSLSGHPAPSREAGQVAPTVPSRISAGGGHGPDFDCDGGLIASTGYVSDCLNAGGMGRQDYETETLIAATLTSNGDAHSGFRDEKGLVPVAIQKRAVSENLENGPQGKGWQERIAYTLEARNKVQAVAFDTTQVTSPSIYSNPKTGDPCHPLAAGAHAPALIHQSAVRRLTPKECERLQGFPDDWTLVPYRGKLAADGPRYKALGNSFAVPVVRWIGERIAAVDTPECAPAMEAAE